MEDRAATLRAMRICRFCLTEKDPLNNIYERDNKNAIPLPLQIMACVTIEVFANDGMPQLICDDCRLQTRKSYSFKTMCKKSDDALKLYLATGILNKHEKEAILQTKSNQKRTLEMETQTSSPKRNKSEEVEEELITDNSIVIETEIVNNSNNDNCEEQKPKIEIEIVEEVNEEALEKGEVAKPEPKPKQVVTHCFSCSHCERSFPLQQLLDIHMRQHTRERKFSCEDCGKRFFSKHDLSKHMQTHSDEKPFTCVVCDKTFSRATLLHRHEKVHVSVPKYLCTYCEKTYLTSEDLDNHMVTHKKKRPFKCDHCDKSFAFKQGLERHVVIHNPENPFKCDYCEESFTTAGKLARHVTSHAGTRPFPCKLCPRTFLLSHHLTRHLRNHYNRKAMENEYGEHKCDICSMSFRRKDSLVNHTAIHSMVNLKCVICNKEFSDAKTVKEHVSTHLAGLPFPCDKCDYSFETQEELEDHEVKHYEFDEYDEDENYVGNVEEEQILPRRSPRESKVKNYADFLKDTFSSDSDENVDEPEEIKPDIPKLQPVVRSETVKTYKGKDKNLEKKISSPLPEATPLETAETATKAETAPKSVTKITTLENLGISKQTLDAMTEKSGFVEMKVGQKVIRVQKLMMTKAEYQAMAKKGKIEMKGSTVVVQNLEGGLDFKKLTQLTKNAEQVPKITDNPKTPVRTYIKKNIKLKDDSVVEETTKEPINENIKNESDETSAPKADDVIIL